MHEACGVHGPQCRGQGRGERADGGHRQRAVFGDRAVEPHPGTNTEASHGLSASASTSITVVLAAPETRIAATALCRSLIRELGLVEQFGLGLPHDDEGIVGTGCEQRAETHFRIERADDAVAADGVRFAGTAGVNRHEVGNFVSTGANRVAAASHGLNACGLYAEYMMRTCSA